MSEIANVTTQALYISESQVGHGKQVSVTGGYKNVANFDQ